MPSFIFKMKYTTTIAMGILLISLTSAININLTSGESTSFDLGGEFAYYSIIGNNSDVDLTINTSGTWITILLGKYNPTDSFSIIFFNKEKEVIHHYSGGSSKTIYVQNKTIEYMDKIIYKDNETIKEETFKDPEVNILKDTSWEYWYLYLFTFGVISGLVYLWVKYIYGKEESEILDELEKEDVSPLE